jgi:hypothetical protein
MYKKHTYDSKNRCINCGGSREMVESNNWECSLIDTPAVNGPRIEVSHDFTELESYILKIPSVAHVMGVNEMDNTWTLHIDIELDEKQRCIITSEDENFTPKQFLKSIQSRFPNPVADESTWIA